MCATCGHQVSVTAGTIFQDTRTPLTLWFRAIWWVVRIPMDPERRFRSILNTDSGGR
jgi:hypothetical protein